MNQENSSEVSGSSSSENPTDPDAGINSESIPPGGHWRYRALWIILVVFLIGADQITKSLIVNNLYEGQNITVIKGFFFLTHIQNQGAAFGMFSDLPDGWRELFLTSLGAVALTLVIYYSLRLRPWDWLGQVALHMIFAGAVGNLIDRFVQGSVTDFILFRFGGWSFPAFNIADSAIVTGVGLLLLDVLIPQKKEEKIKPEEAGGAQPEAVPANADSEG